MLTLLLLDFSVVILPADLSRWKTKTKLTFIQRASLSTLNILCLHIFACAMKLGCPGEAYYKNKLLTAEPSYITVTYYQF